MKISLYFIDVGRFIALVALQIFLLDKIYISGYVNPYGYLLFILLLPFNIPGWLLLISAFLLGSTIDIFTNSSGLHASATVLMAFLRPFVIQVIGKPDSYDPWQRPGLNDMGFRWFLTYSLILVFIHHLMLFALDAFRLQEIGSVVVRTLFSTAVTVLILLILNILFRKRK